MGDILSMWKKLLTNVVNLRAMDSFPDEFKCSPCLVKYFLSRSVSRIFTLLYCIILFLSCLLKLITSLFTQDEERRSCLGGAVITTIFTVLFFSIKLHKCLRASLELFFPMSFDPPHIITTET